MSGAHIVENMNTENTNISRTTASGGAAPPAELGGEFVWGGVGGGVVFLGV